MLPDAGVGIDMPEKLAGFLWLLEGTPGAYRGHIASRYSPNPSYVAPWHASRAGSKIPNTIRCDTHKYPPASFAAMIKLLGLPVRTYIRLPHP